MLTRIRTLWNSLAASLIKLIAPIVAWWDRMRGRSNPPRADAAVAKFARPSNPALLNGVAAAAAMMAGEEGSRELQRNLPALSRRIYGEAHERLTTRNIRSRDPALLPLLCNMAEIARLEGRDSQARALAGRALALAREVYGPRHGMFELVRARFTGSNDNAPQGAAVHPSRAAQSPPDE